MDLGLYVLQSSLCLALFYAFYWFVLKQEKGFKANRLYLLLTLIGSFLIPLLHIPIEVLIELPTIEEEVATAIVEATTIEATTPTAVSLYTLFLQKMPVILLGVYLLGALIRLFVFSNHLLVLRSLIRSGNRVRKGKVLHIYNPKVDTIFSFMNIIFWGGQEPHPSDKERMLQHELAHVDQYHSLDILLCEILKIPFWFNPLIYWYKSSLQEVHEYLADEAVIKKEGRMLDYANLLVQQAKRYTRVYSISNLLFQKPIKNRLIMMKKSKQVLRHSMKIMSMAPIALGLVYSLCVEYDYKSVHTSSPLEQMEQSAATIALDTVKTPEGQIANPRKGACYSKCLLPDKTRTMTVSYPVYSGNGNDGVATKEIKIQTKIEKNAWDKKRKPDCKSDDPNDCLIWHMVIVPGETKTLTVVKDAESTDKFNLETYNIELLVEEGLSDWQETVCDYKITKSFILELQQKLNARGAKLDVTGQLDKSTISALSNFQKSSNLPYANLSIASMKALGVKI